MTNAVLILIMVPVFNAVVYPPLGQKMTKKKGMEVEQESKKEEKREEAGGKMRRKKHGKEGEVEEEGEARLEKGDSTMDIWRMF